MLLVYRFLWIAAALGVVACLLVLSNPHRRAPVASSRWVSVQLGQFALDAPADFRAYRDPLTQMGMNTPNSPIQLRDAIRVERGVRTGLKLLINTLRTDLQASGGEPVSTNPSENYLRLIARVHDVQKQKIAEAVADFREKQSQMVRIRGAVGLRTDFEYTHVPLLPLFRFRVQGYMITVPISSAETLHMIVYYPPERAHEYGKVFDKMLNSLRLGQAKAEAEGGWY